MSPRICLSCRRLNPSLAVYCYFDGTPLVSGARGTAMPQQFPSPFVFPSGLACRSWNELAHTCRQNWQDARRLLKDRGIQPFLATLGRADLVQAADRAAAHPDPDLGLDDFLACLPDCQPSPAGLEVGCTELDLGTVAVGQDRSFVLTVRNTGERLLSGLVRSENSLWLAVSTPQLREKRFKATAHQQLEVPLHVVGKQLRAGTQPQVAEVVVESNGGTHRVQVRVRVPVTPFPDGVFQGAQTPRQLAEKARTALPETARLLEDGSVARWYQSNGWTYPITGPPATGLAAVQQYFEALGLVAPPRVELRTGEVALQGLAGGATSGRVVLGTADKRPVYAQAQSDQPWLSVGPVECRGAEAVIPIRVATVPACPGQTLQARVSVQTNGQRQFQVPVRLYVEPASFTEVQQKRNTRQYAAPLTDAQLPPLPDWVPEGQGQASLPPGSAGDGSAPRGSRWGTVLACLLVLCLLAGAGAIAWMVDRDADADPAVAANMGTPTTKAAAPPTTKPTPPPTTKKVPEKEPENPLLRALVRHLGSDELETNRQALEELKELLTVDEAEARRAIPALVKAAGRRADEGFRQDVARALKLLGPPRKEDVNCLKDALGIPHPALRNYVFSALKEMGEDRARAAMGVVAEALKHPDPKVRREAMAFLKTLGPTARRLALGPLLNPAGDANVEAVRGALAALLEWGPLTAGETDVPAEALGDVRRRTWVRCFAADLLAEAGPQAAREVPALLGVLQEKSNVALQTRSIQALGRIGDRRPEVLTLLLKTATSHGEEKVRLEALQVLKQLDPSALSTAQIVGRWIAEKGSSVRPVLVGLLEARLAALKPEELIELRPLLQHKDPEVIQVGLKVVQDRKEAAAGVAAEVAALLEHDDARVRGGALAAMQALGPAASKTLPDLSRVLLDRWPAEKDSTVRDILARLLRARYAALRAEEMTELLPLLRHKDPKIIQVALNVVQDRKEEAAGVAAEVADLLRHDDAAVRGAAVAALEALGPAASKALPGLSRLLLNRRRAETDPGIRQALAGLLEARLARLKPEEMTELLPLLGHKDPEIVQVGLRIVRDRKEDAAGVAAEVAAVLEHDDAALRGAAVSALESLGPAAQKALPKLFEILKEMPKYQRTSLAFTVSRIVDFKDSENVQRLVPFLVESLHPESLRDQGEKNETRINDVLRKIGQPAVDGIFSVLDAGLKLEIAGVDNVNYRKNLYIALAGLAPRCRSKDNYDELMGLEKREQKKKYPDVIAAARRALAAMNPN